MSEAEGEPDERNHITLRATLKLGYRRTYIHTVGRTGGLLELLSQLKKEPQQQS